MACFDDGFSLGYVINSLSCLHWAICCSLLFLILPINIIGVFEFIEMIRFLEHYCALEFSSVGFGLKNLDLREKKLELRISGDSKLEWILNPSS